MDAAFARVYHVSSTRARQRATRDVVHAVFAVWTRSNGRRGQSPPVQLVAVIADTHLPRGGRRLPDGCLELLAAADLIVHAGDVASAAALRELEALGPVAAVHGNVDDEELRRALPARRVVEVERARIGVVHDAGPREGRHARLVAEFPDCDAIVYGHTHLPELGRAGAVWILNPGSPTERRRAQRRSLIALEVDGRGLSPRLVTLP